MIEACAPLAKKMVLRGVKDALAKDIIASNLPARTPILSTKEIAERYKVSFLTANRAVNQLVEEGVLFRERGSGTFIAESGRDSKLVRCKVALVSPPFYDTEEQNATVGAYFHPAAEALARERVHIEYVPHTILEDLEKLKAFDAVMARTEHIDKSSKTALKNYQGIVLMTHLEWVSSLPFNQVIPDMAPGFSELIALFMKNGAARIHVPFVTTSPHSVHKTDAFMAAAALGGFPRESIITHAEDSLMGDFGRLCGKKVAEKILAEDNNPAIFTGSDFIAFGIMDTMLAKGKKPGKDFLLASFDNVEDKGILPFKEAVLTSVDYPRKEISLCAAHLIERLLLDNDHYAHITRVTTKLITRETLK